jgi:AAA+ ATPase superfamily predicted ATPase
VPRRRVQPKLRNPFTYGDLAADESFTDRRDELKQLRRGILNGQNVALIAPRRYGKSSLVRAALNDLTGRGVLAVEVDLLAAPTKERLAGKLAKSIDSDIAPIAFKAKEHLRIFQSLRVAPVVTVGGDGSFSFSFSAARAPEEIDETLERLLALPATVAADTGRQVVVFFDEFQEVTEIDPKLPALMRSVFQQQRHVSHVYAGSKRDMMHRLFNHENEPFFRSAKTMEIGLISPSLFQDFIRERFEATERGVSDAVAGRLLGITKGHPYATQELAYALWDEVPHGFTATDDDLDHALRAVLHAENAHFTLVWERATKPQKLLLQALANEAGRPFSVAFRDRHGLPSSSHVQRALKPLLDGELVAKEERGSYEIAEPFLREWILANAS